jgi:hypothetical protein
MIAKSSRLPTICSIGATGSNMASSYDSPPGTKARRSHRRKQCMCIQIPRCIALSLTLLKAMCITSSAAAAATGGCMACAVLSVWCMAWLAVFAKCRACSVLCLGVGISDPGELHSVNLWVLEVSQRVSVASNLLQKGWTQCSVRRTPGYSLPWLL